VLLWEGGLRLRRLSPTVHSKNMNNMKPQARTQITRNTVSDMRRVAPISYHVDTTQADEESS
jgi:hypothetical protein